MGTDKTTYNGYIMTNFRNVLFLGTVLFLGAATVNFAQEPSLQSETQTTAKTEPVETLSEGGEATGTTGNIEDLSLGQQTQIEPVVGQTFVKEVIGDWQLRCVKGEEDTKDTCQMYQLMDDGQGSPIAEVSIFRLENGGRAKAGSTIIVPLETALQQQITISVDGGQTRRYPYSFCNQVGCYARVGFTSEDIANFKRGNAAKVTIVPALAPDNKVELILSLTGFTVAYDKVSIAKQ